MVTETCPVLPSGPYTTRPIYTYLNNQNYTVPYDNKIEVKLGTHYQVLKEEQADLIVVNNQSHNMYPKPTHAHLSVPQDTGLGRLWYWQYEFEKVRTFNWNFIFGGTDDYNPQNTCASTVNMNQFVPGVNKSANGKQIWFYHGAEGQRSIFGSLGDYSLPEINWILGFKVNRMNSCGN